MSLIGLLLVIETSVSSWHKGHSFLSLEKSLFLFKEGMSYNNATRKRGKRDVPIGEVALVTGSSRGLGRNIALRLADVVSAVAVHYKSSREKALEVVNAIEERGKKSAAFQADLIKQGEASRLIGRVEERFDRIDILINNFGPILVKPWMELTAKDWQFVLRSNLESAFFCLKAVLPGMKRRNWGRIINIGYSRAEQLVAFSSITPYAIAKTGLLILTRSVAASVASSGITVNMVSPGLMEGGVLPPSRSVPKGRLGRFEDVSEAVLFLVSEKAGYITGTNLVVAGGWKV
jgi:3-oxoacyl-[acyl-carrier protein] reductase